MRSIRRPVSRPVLVTAALILVTFATAAADDATVGRFVQDLARHRGLDASGPTASVEALRASGISLPALPLDAALTEGAVVAIVRAFGVDVVTSRPDRTLDARFVDRFLAGFADRLEGPRREPAEGENPGQGSGPGNGNGGPPFDPFTKGKGLGKGKGKGSQTETAPD